MKKEMITIIVVLSFALSTMPADESEAEGFRDVYSLKLTDSEGNDLTDPLFGGDVTVYFDTYCSCDRIVYKLKAMLSIRTVPANIIVKASGGQFKLAVSATGIDSFLVDTGLRFTINHGDDVFTADLKSTNNFSDEFRNSGNTVWIDPNINYSVSVCLIDGYESDVPPESVSNIKITFQAIAADGYHQVMFISEDEVVESYMALDNQVIEKTPSVSRSGYTFKGWFTPDGREITDGYVISPDEGDIIAYAEWEKNDSGSNIVPIAIGGGSAALLGLFLLLFLLKRKKDNEPN